jgi:acyl transferase domain-containing protein/acyl-CoA synthetase (AMP-forming)/AMP-acid ligase II/acyl carrier protein
MNTFKTYIDLLEYRANLQPNDIAYTYIHDDYITESSITYKELSIKTKSVAYYLQKNDFCGKRALLLYTPGLDFIISFLGCLYAGVIAVPAYPPEINRIEHTLKRIETIIKDSNTSVILTTSYLYKQTEKILPKLSKTNLKDLLWIQSDLLNNELSNKWEKPSVNENTIAFLQYTSGSTANPKGVIINHKNLLYNQEMLKLALGHKERESVMACWVPFYHDMGLIGHILQTLYIGSKTIIMSPISFLKNPYKWLEVISKNNVYSAGAPNFAFDLCVKKVSKEQVKSLDLSNFKVASNGAEPIKKETLDRFTEHFKESGFKHSTHKATYGLAEATIFVSIADDGEPKYVFLDKDKLENNKVFISNNNENTIPFISCGKGRLEEKIYIVSPQTKKICNNDEIGEIWVSGQHIAQGYWNLSEETENTFKNYINETREESFLRTGDLGFIYENNLYVTGRIKDLIIINGRNIYPQDIEKDIETLRKRYKSIRLGCNAVFCLNNSSQEKIVLFQEIDENESDFEDLSNSILDLINKNFELPVEDIVFLKAGTIAKTSSGKIMRQACKKAYLSDFSDKSFKVIFKLTDKNNNNLEKTSTENNNIKQLDSKKQYEIENWLKSWISKELNIINIDINKNFSFYGLNSASSISLTSDLENFLNYKLYETILWDYKNIKSLSEYLSLNNYDDKNINLNKNNSKEELNNDIAVIGMSCRFPNNSDTPDKFWYNLENNIDCITNIPVSRWNNEKLIELNKTYVKQGGFINDVDMFEPEFFYMTKKEAIGTDPQQRLLLELSWEALENSGIIPSHLKDSNTGVFIGISTNDYSKSDINSGNFSLIDQYSGIGNALSVASGRISYTYGFQGANLTVDTACSSSLVSVHLACQSLINNESELCLAGGVNLILSPDLNIYFSQINALSIDNRCKTFDESANGYVRSEGIGFVVLKKLSQALKDNNNILAIIKESTINHDGNSQGLTAPNGQSQIKLMKKALEKANLKPDDISYIETHGTGTNLGDPIELRAINEVFKSESENKIILGALKSNIGHLEASAGIASLIKTILCLNNKKIPSNLHFNKLNSKSYLDEKKFSIANDNIDWNTKKRIAFVNSFGISGTNANLIIEESNNQYLNKSEESNKVNILTISAQTDESLLKNTEKYLEFIEKTNQSFDDISYTSTCLRTHFTKRVSYIFSNKKEIVNQLKSFINNEDSPGLIKNILKDKINPKISFVYSGHGSQWIDMAKEFLKFENEFKSWIEKIDKISKKYINWSIIEFLINNSDENKLDDISIIQPCIFSIQVALSKILINYGIKPEAVIGHSMGEISACFIAGILDLDSAVKIICERSKLMQENPDNGAMLFCEIDYDKSLKLIEHQENKVSIGICNNNNSVVLSGDKNHLDKIQKDFDKEKIFNSWVKFNGAAHSYKMEKLKQPLLEKIKDVNHTKSDITFYSSTIGDKINLNEYNSDYWIENLRNTVFFNKSFDNALKDGFNTFIEISPHSVLSIVMKNSIKDKNIDAFSTSSLLKNKDDNFELKRLVGELYNLGIEINWNKIYPKGNLINLPNYQWNKKSYWKNIPSNSFGNIENNLYEKDMIQEEFKIPNLPQDWIYEIEYEKKDINNINTNFNASFLVFADDLGISENFKIILDSNKHNFVYVHLGSEYKKINDNKYFINHKNLSDYKKLFDEINIDNFSKIVHFWSIDNNKNIEPNYDIFLDNSNKGIISCINIIKSINDISNHRLYAITTATLYNNYDNSDKNINYNQSAILGLGKVANYEIPKLKFTNIDISYDYVDIESGMIYDEIKSNSDETIVLIRDEQRLVPRINNYKSKTKIKVEESQNNNKSFFNKIFSKKANKKLKEVEHPEINNNATYLIAGGTGGLGLLFTKYLIDNGAKNIILCSRNGANEETQKEIDKLKNKSNIHVFKTDISNQDDLKNLFDHIKEFPPLKGIIHSALVLNDSSIKTHQKEYFENVMKPKVKGIINLHNISKDLDINFFIMFSSLTSILGLKYFTNYSASNSFIDSFAHYRRKIGLPAISINWGPWSEVGQAAYYQESKDLEKIGITNISPDMGLKIFENIFKLNPVQVIAMNINMSKFLNYYPEAQYIKMYEKLIPKNLFIKEIKIFKDELVKKNDLLDNNQIKYKKTTLNNQFSNNDIKDIIKKEVSLILNVSSENINVQEHFRNYGLDSLMAIEMINNLSEKFDIEIDNQVVRECPNIETLTNHIFLKLNNN